MERTCPLCKSALPASVERCDCGYVFDTCSDEITVSPTVEVVRQVERETEYESFYVSRLDNAQKDLKALIVRYGKSGWTPAQRDEIERAIKQVDTAKAELATQRARSSDAQQHLDRAKTRVELRQINALANKKI